MKKKTLKIIQVILKLALTVLYLAPTWMVLVNSLKEKKLANRFGTGLPEVWRFSNYAEVFKSADISRAFMNGLIISCGSVLLIVLFGSLAAFVIARSGSKLVRAFYYVFLAGLVIPVAFIPTYLVLNTFRLLNTYQGLILISATYGLPMSIFMYVGFVKTVPRDLDEAGIIDGCTPLSLYWRIVFPLLKPITATLVVLNFVGCWNDVQVPLFFASSDKWALPMTVYNFYGAHASSWNLIFADIIITIAPLLVLYLAAQNFIMEGMTAGAVKG